MRKKAKKLTAIILSAMLIITSVISASAAQLDTEVSAFPTKAADNTVTTVTFTDGSTKSYSGMADAGELEEWGGISKVASYSVAFEGGEIFSVTLRDIEPADSAVSASESRELNGYYAIDFDMPVSNREVFLTGLTPRNLALTQEKILTGYKSGSDFELQSIDYIDVEKTQVYNTDDNLCWAAAASNILTYTDWLRYSPYDSNYELFDGYVDNFYDGGGASLQGSAWFFNGIYPFDIATTEQRSGTALMKNETDSGNFVSDYPYESIVTEYSFSSCNDNIATIQKLMGSLRDGMGVILAVIWEQNGMNMGGHAISCWGYVLNNDYPEDDYRHYEALIISDSDSDEQLDPERRAAPNKLNMLHMTSYFVLSPSLNAVVGWRFTNYGEIGGLLYGFEVVKPSGDFIDIDPDSGTLDKQNSPDPAVNNIYMGHFDYGMPSITDTCNTFYLGETIEANTKITNNSYVTYEGDLTLDYTVTDENGAVCFEKQFNSVSDTIEPFYKASFEYDNITAKISGLKAGSYTLTVKLTGSGEEAYYGNNIRSESFTVSDRYDISGIKINAEFLPEYRELEEYRIMTAGKFRLTYEGLEELADKIEGYTAIYESSDLEIPMWAPAGSTTGAELSTSNTIEDYAPVYYDTPPQEAELRISAGNGTNPVSYALGIKLKGVSSPVFVYSDTAYYTSYFIEQDHSEDYAYVTVQGGEASYDFNPKVRLLNKNEARDSKFTGTYQLALRKNRLTSDGRVSETEYSGEPRELVIEPGGEFKKSFDIPAEWLNHVSGALCVHVNGTFANGEQFMEMCEIGTLIGEEIPSLVVNSTGDIIDDTDCVTTLREAIAYSESLGSGDNVVTFDLPENEGNTIQLNEEIRVFSDIKIDGKMKNGENVAIGGDMLSTGAFIVSDGSLIIKNVDFRNHYSNNSGGVFRINGAKLELTDCNFISCNALLYGGVAYVRYGGELRMNRCTAAECTAAAGSVVYITDEVTAELLNCTFDNNRSKQAAIYNMDSLMNIVSCTLYGNGESVAGNGAINSEGETNLINSIVVGNGIRNRSTRIVGEECNLSGKVNACGSIVGESDNLLVKYTACKTGVTSGEVFVVDENGIVQKGKISGVISMPKLIASGIEGSLVTVSEGKLCCTAGGNTVDTGATAAFDESEYSIDCLQNARTGACGSLEPKQENIYGDLDGDGVVTILDAVIIQKAAVDSVELTDEQKAAADVNGDGVVTILDAACIQKYAADKTSGIGRAGQRF